MFSWLPSTSTSGRTSVFLTWLRIVGRITCIEVRQGNKGVLRNVANRGNVVSEKQISEVIKRKYGPFSAMPCKGTRKLELCSVRDEKIIKASIDLIIGRLRSALVRSKVSQTMTPEADQRVGRCTQFRIMKHTDTMYRTSKMVSPN